MCIHRKDLIQCSYTKNGLVCLDCTMYYKNLLWQTSTQKKICDLYHNLYVGYMEEYLLMWQKEEFAIRNIDRYITHELSERYREENAEPAYINWMQSVEKFYKLRHCIDTINAHISGEKNYIDVLLEY